MRRLNLEYLSNVLFMFFFDTIDGVIVFKHLSEKIFFDLSKTLFDTKQLISDNKQCQMKSIYASLISLI